MSISHELAACNRESWPLIERRNAIQPRLIRNEGKQWQRRFAWFCGPRQRLAGPAYHYDRVYTAEQLADLERIDAEIARIRRKHGIEG